MHASGWLSSWENHLTRKEIFKGHTRCLWSTTSWLTESVYDEKDFEQGSDCPSRVFNPNLYGKGKDPFDQRGTMPCQAKETITSVVRMTAALRLKDNSYGRRIARMIISQDVGYSGRLAQKSGGAGVWVI
jgi:hypothetical protein